MRLQLSDIIARDSCQLPTAGFEGVVRTLGPEIGTGPLVEPEPALFPLLCRLLQPPGRRMHSTRFAFTAYPTSRRSIVIPR